MRILILLLCLATPLAAQPFDLNTLPEDYRFTDHGSDGNTDVRYVGREGDAFIFAYQRDDSVGNPATFTSWANQASQLIRWRGADGTAAMSPHDCWPTLGSCDYVITYGDGERIEIHSSMIRIGDIWEHRRYVDVNGISTLYERGCTRMDEYGFPIDNWTEYWDGEEEWSERVTTMGQPDPRSDLKALTLFCKNRDDLVS